MVATVSPVSPAPATGPHPRLLSHPGRRGELHKRDTPAFTRGLCQYRDRKGASVRTPRHNATPSASPLATPTHSPSPAKRGRRGREMRARRYLQTLRRSLPRPMCLSNRESKKAATSRGAQPDAPLRSRYWLKPPPLATPHSPSPAKRSRRGRGMRAQRHLQPLRRSSPSRGPLEPGLKERRQPHYAEPSRTLPYGRGTG